MTLTRRDFVAGTLGAAAIPSTRRLAPQVQTRHPEAVRAIGAMVERYMSDMNAPGLTLAVADRNETLLTGAFGFSDPDRREPVQPEQLFHIGSITKSFVGIALLQLRDEGQIDLHAPVSRFLPWLRIEPRDVITTHHLLTHSSGLPSWVPVFPSDPDARHVAGFTPGAHFHYCNLGYAILGHLIEALDGRPWPESIRARIFKPLGMHASEAVIGPELRARTVESHIPYRDELPYPRRGRLARAPQIVFDSAAGSISSTPHDMGLYLRMLASRGRPLLSEAAFAELTKPHVPTGSPDEAYGYGLFVNKLDEHRVVRHTGGMVSFMSAMHVDLDDGVGAFASVNAQQGYRPNPVTLFAIRAIRASTAKKPLPELPPPNPPAKIADAAQLAGVYTSPEGERLELVAEGESLFLMHDGKRLPIELATGQHYVQHPDFELYPLHFEREQEKVLSVAHGSRWWMSPHYSGERSFAVPDAWRAFTGHYRSEDPWMGSMRIVARQGKLWVGGTTPLRQVDAITFRFADSGHNPEWIRFLDIVQGKAQHVKLSGYDLWRVAAR
jgi:CubicO group peptidase (beta-lactamase class C family)